MQDDGDCASVRNRTNGVLSWSRGVYSWCVKILNFMAVIYYQEN